MKYDPDEDADFKKKDSESTTEHYFNDNLYCYAFLQ